jgi:hypothetical protein
MAWSQTARAHGAWCWPRYRLIGRKPGASGAYSSGFTASACRQIHFRGVTAGIFNKTVSRGAARFPKKFSFVRDREEVAKPRGRAWVTQAYWHGW